MARDKKIVMFIAQKDFRDEEFLLPKKILESRGIKVFIASKDKNLAIGQAGTKIDSDLAVAEVTADNFDGLCIIGGPGLINYFEDEEVLQLIRNFSSQGKLLSAICLGTSLLANAGAIISKNVTGLNTEEQNLRNKGGDYTGMPVVIDGNLITAKDAGFAKEFGLALADYL